MRLSLRRHLSLALAWLAWLDEAADSLRTGAAPDAARLPRRSGANLDLS